MRSIVTIFPVCSCQRPIGHVYPVYRYIYEKRREHILENKGEEFSILPCTSDEGLLMEDVLDALGIMSECCRATIICHAP